MAIPEFILRKLVVPQSFKETSDGFSFILSNSFAPATISRFGLRVGENHVPAENISILIEGQPPVSGSAVRPDNPLALPTGIEIKVVAGCPSGGLPVYINAMTREVGEIDFCLIEGKNPSPPKALKPFFFSFFYSLKKAHLTIFTKQVLNPVSPFILGQFVEHLERCVYDGIWTADGQTLREDTLDLINQLSPPLIRYPGGNFASGYHWEDGIGPISQRPARHDAAWQAEESNKVGTDEFLSFCELIGAEPLLVANDGSGSADEAARWVAYCNDPIGSEQGNRRAANGHPEPYHVKYWGIGNEVWGAWQIGTTTAKDYSQRAKHFISAMKAVDPSIKIVVVGNSPLTDDPEDEAAVWNRTVLEKLGKDIDYLSWHIYQPDKADWRETYDPHELYFAVCAAPLDIAQILTRIEKQIEGIAAPRKILQAVDEWNLWLLPLDKKTSMHNVTYTLRDALYTASTLITFYKHSRSVGMANLAQLVNVLPLIKTKENKAFATAIFFPFVLFRQMQPYLLHTQCSCETFDTKRISINMSAHEKVPYLDELATISEDGRCLSVVLVNRFPINQMKVHIRLENADGVVKNALRITAASPSSFNDSTHPNRVHISDLTSIQKESDGFSVILRPCSVSLLEFELKKAG